MFDFFQNIFGKVISLMASVIIAVGLVSVAPEEPKQPLPSEQQKGEIILETGQKESWPEKQPERKPEAGINKQHEAESRVLEEKIRWADIEIAELERQRIKDEKEAENKAKEEVQRQAVAEAQRQEEARIQDELEKILAEKAEARRKAKEETAQKEYEAQTTQKIELDISRFSDLISSVNQKIEQTTNNYRVSIDKEWKGYFNITSGITSIFKPKIVERHEKMRENISNAGQFKPWFICSGLQWSWDEQNNDRQEYNLLLKNAERSFKNNINLIINSSTPNLDSYLIEMERLKQQVNDFFHVSPVSNAEYRNDINNLISSLNSLELKIDNTKNYNISIVNGVRTFSYSSPTAILSKEVDPLLTEEKEWFAKIKSEWGWQDDDCWHLPTY